jgi:hypothetical protein
MYGQQASIDPSLAALLQTAQMVTPDQMPTVAAQVAQAAQQKMQPQGMPQAQQDFQSAMPSMMRNMQQAQMQQMVQQAMQPKPAGIEGLPSNIRMAEGGVVGYAGPDGSSVEVDESQLSVSERLKRDLRRLYEGIETGYMKRAGATPEQIAQKLGQEPPVLQAPQVDFRDSRYRTTELRKGEEGVLEKIGPAHLDKKPEIQLLTSSSASRPPAQRPPAPAQTEPQAGIASLPAAPALDKSGISTAGEPIIKAAADREARMRGILSDREKMAAGMADLSAEGIAALQEANRARQELLGKQRGDDKFNRQMALLRGFQGDRAAYDRAVAGQQARDEAANQAQLMHQQAVLKLREAQQAKQLGQFDRAMAFEQQAAELEGKARTSALEEKRIAASLATNEYSNLVSLRGQDIQAREGELNRAQNERLERIRKATANQPGEAERIFNEYTRRKAIDPKDAEAYLTIIDRIKGSGRGMDLKETSVELRALKDEEQQLLKRLEATFSSQERGPINARLEQISRDRVKLMGGTPTSAEPPRLPPQAVSQLKEGVVTKFANGQQWTLRNGQPTQVK